MEFWHGIVLGFFITLLIIVACVFAPTTNRLKPYSASELRPILAESTSELPYPEILRRLRDDSITPEEVWQASLKGAVNRFANFRKCRRKRPTRKVVR